MIASSCAKASRRYENKLWRLEARAHAHDDVNFNVQEMGTLKMRIEFIGQELALQLHFSQVVLEDPMKWIKFHHESLHLALRENLVLP